MQCRRICPEPQTFLGSEGDRQDTCTPGTGVAASCIWFWFVYVKVWARMTQFPERLTRDARTIRSVDGQ